MENSANLWQAWVLSQKLRIRPSELYGITDGFEAFCFDRAVASFGLAVDADLEDAADGAKSKKQAERKQQMRLDKWLREPDDWDNRKFRDPAEMMRRT